MKWKLFQLSVIINLGCIAAFAVMVAYVLSSPGTTSDSNIMFLFILGAVISAARGFIGLYFLRIIRTNTIFMGKYKIAYVLCSVIQTIAAIFIIYSAPEEWRRLQYYHWDSVFIASFSIMVCYSLTALIITSIDFVLFPALERQSDPSIGILEDQDAAQ